MTHSNPPAPTGKQPDTPIQGHVTRTSPKRPPTYELTPKQQQFVKNIVDKKMTKTEAYLEAYDHSGTRKTAHEEASRTARTPQVRLELIKYNDMAKSVVIDVMETSLEKGRSGTNAGAAYMATALTAANSLIDRVDGKATQRVEVQSQAVVINIDLTGVTDSNTDTQTG